jgi:hypothetical protein
MFQLNAETFCYLEDAEKLMFHLKSTLSISLDLSPPQHRKACWYQTEHEISFPISYYEPSGMVNITQILNLLDDNVAHSCLEGIYPIFQQVRGSSQWEGYYINSESTDKVLSRLDLETSQSYRMTREAPSCPDIFYNNDPNRFIVIASREMIGLIFLQRDGTSVKLNGSIQTVETAITECEKHGLSVTATTIQTYVPSEPDWTSHGGSSQAIKLFDEPNCPSEAEYNSFYHLEERTRFTLRKRKAPSDIPVLPQPRRPRVGQTTLTEICESWIKQVADDIRPSKFWKQ